MMMVPALLAFAVDFKNFTYATNPCSGNVPVPVVMRKGYFGYFDPKMAAGFDLSVESVTRGSLRTGTRQAVIVVRCDFPVGGTAAAYAYDETGGRARFLRRVAVADWGPDWGAGPQSIVTHFSGGSLLVRHCATQECVTDATSEFRLRGNALIEIPAPRRAKSK